MFADLIVVLVVKDLYRRMVCRSSFSPSTPTSGRLRGASLFCRRIHLHRSGLIERCVGRRGDPFRSRCSRLTLKRFASYEDDAAGVADLEDHREQSETKVQHDGDVQLDVTPPGRADELAVDFLRGEDETQVEAGAVRCARPCTGRQRQYQRES